MSVVAACSTPEQAAPDPCASLTDAVIDSIAQTWSTEHGVRLPKLSLRPAVLAACRNEGWRADNRLANTRELLATILPTHIGGAAAGGLAESGPHPDYPTPLAAGTSNIFFLEDPDRGPPLPTRANIPPRGALAWTTHAYCSLMKTSFACSAAAKGTGLSTFRVGRKADVAVIEERYGDRLVQTAMYTSKDGAPVQRIVVDARGHIVSALMSRDGKMTGRVRNGGNALEGCGMSRHETTGKVSQLTCLQWLGEPMLDMTGVATEKFTRDDRGFIITDENFGIDGKPIANASGAARVTSERDMFGRVTVRRTFDLDGARVAGPDGCSGERYEYGADGQLSRITCLDNADLPSGRSNGVAILETLYDARGCAIGTRYLDKDAKPTTNPDGVHGEDSQVDRYCTQTRSTCIDMAGSPHACGVGRSAQYRIKLDSAGNAVAMTHFNALGERAVDDEFDTFELRFKYDALGNQTSLACFDDGGHARECEGTGFHEKKTAFDANGRRIVESFFGSDGRAADNLGASSRRYKYDNYDHPFESQSYDASNHLVAQEGMATMRELYDIRHQRFALVLLDVDGKPAKYTACFTGATCPDPPQKRPWHAVRIVRLGDGTVEYNQFFDADGQLMEAVNCRTSKCFH